VPAGAKLAIPIPDCQGAAAMIHLKDILYVRLGTRDLEGAVRYAQTILGLQPVASIGNIKNGQVRYFRSDTREHTLAYFDGDPQDHTAGFEVASLADLDAAAAELERLGHAVKKGSPAEAEVRGVEAFINFRDPSGNSLDLAVKPFFSGSRYFPSRDAGITGFSHIGLRTTDAKRDEAFWTQVLSARVSDRIGAAPLLRIDEVHHKIALFPSAFPGIQHVNHQVAEVDDIMRSAYFLKDKGIRIVFGPGRHPTSGARFVYFEGPDGMVYEYSCGVRLVTDENERPRQFPFKASSFCMWGSRPDIPEFRE
jgi:2,3-dihydroxy-p-cumate/2,3-dihydroxybenzoate 3,4-dioxygenase